MTSTTDERVAAFFDAYAAASLAGDAATIGAAYAPTYIESAPSGMEAFQVDAAYRRAVAAKAAAMRRMGLSASQAVVREVRKLAPKHLLVEVAWRLRFEPAGRAAAEAAFRISYVLRLDDDVLRILLALSHDDEARALEELGLS
ncbi:hypothetical protein GWK16_01850 [Roseomonas sp. JC162]|uniref:Nuclear transport factor 2 family protein n=1 Tax=Neoroseomonas marina TaxID=1232220 RepID=A0A848E8R6_9PROT|nr:hypothetical protein [Neoroseomonas marina]NMJ39967.1 hypothetical protein [Neoroseomonas marina]